MSVHNLTWIVTSSAVGATQVIHDALEWLTGGRAELTHEKVKSYHGPKITLIRAKIDKKKSAREAICQLGSEFLSSLASSEELESRIDDNNALHIRLDLAALVASRVQKSELKGDGVVKGKIKLEVYPGQDRLEIARKMLKKSAVTAESLNLISTDDITDLG